MGPGGAPTSLSSASVGASGGSAGPASGNKYKGFGSEDIQRMGYNQEGQFSAPYDPYTKGQSAPSQSTFTYNNSKVKEDKKPDKTKSKKKSKKSRKKKRKDSSSDYDSEKDSDSDDSDVSSESSEEEAKKPKKSKLGKAPKGGRKLEEQPKVDPTETKP
jgi:hypothetical protein